MCSCPILDGNIPWYLSVQKCWKTVIPVYCLAIIKESNSWCLNHRKNLMRSGTCWIINPIKKKHDNHPFPSKKHKPSYTMMVYPDIIISAVKLMDNFSKTHCYVHEPIKQIFSWQGAEWFLAMASPQWCSCTHSRRSLRTRSQVWLNME
jgi:hypothetical protein